jgi:uncharacterized membrane protein
MSEQAKRPTSFWLIASLLLNMLLIGALGGFLLRAGHGGPGHRGGPEFSENATPDDAAAVRSVMRTAYEATRPHRDTRREARRNLSAAVEQEPYNEAAVATALEAVREAEQAMQVALNDALTRQLAELTPLQRKGVAEAISRGPRGRRGHRGPGRRGDRPRPD